MRYSAGLLLLIIMLIAGPVLALDIGKPSLIQEIFILRSYEKSTGKTRWQSVVKAQEIKYQGQDYIYFLENGRLDDGSENWVSSSYSIITDHAAIPYSVKVLIKSREGATLNSTDNYYDLPHKTVISNINGKITEYKIRPNMVDKQNLGVALMNFPFEKKNEVSYRLLTHEPAEYEIFVKYRGREKVKVGEWETECYKLEMVFNMGILNVFNIFIPKFYLWYEIDPPHNFVKYEGLESGLGTPYVVVARQNKVVGGK